MRSVLNAPPRPHDRAGTSTLFSWAVGPEHGRLVVACAPGTDGVLVVRISGDIDVTTLPSFGSHLDEAIDERLPFVLDLTDVQFCCASALSILGVMAARARRLALPWAVTGNNSVRRPLTAIGMADKIPFCADLEDAFRLVSGELHLGGRSA
ncbi:MULTISPECIES: STAS domain-containing protein [unclassified Rhodococcus (in: high G+C Gram-positive bacteria)]|uniref:STAS domain-containing protein n=1 Tax=unclassified Rhodococcus (in: high G+C Gram-positive bacteria) TaxID=192944 RepID=UPI00163B0871|nr:MULTISPECIES: STAS domain-containing protein [unclassified Rhodococcus (in: high G+C Gram-positive bacteria)]MBC2637965.1 STAS domain-containing protein [Rhodococcus sp. 3A]MBC2897288.1 STAS domain-containing protein [Rhodococcus sp. 4CII]